MTSSEPKFGVWALVNGNWGAKHHPEDPFDASWRRNRDQVLLAEELGYDSTLVAQHTINPSDDTTAHLEAWTASAALAALTERIEIITAIKPFLYHPAVLAKQALQIAEISQGRFSINVVNGWFKPELEKTGLAGLDHDQRYAYGTEWLEVVNALSSGERVTYDGRWFSIDDLQLVQGDPVTRRPTVYVGGESDPARDLVAQHGDVWFINGQPIEDVRSLIDSVARRARTGPPVRYALSAYVIARETGAQAQQAFDEAWELKRREAAALEALLKGTDEQAVMFSTFAKNPAVGTNGGTAAGLVGTYDEVARRIVQFHELGIETFMLQFQPVEEEMRRFAEHVVPRVRELTATRVGTR
ncbi:MULTISPECIES: LLM class flavin-dependent oxidoreductase [unclassified Aeromicrobium]|uniref:LLM class flavin-dependent oxidoreductase n=1 Tax=unclassified Aeromicrobium TaxID=2633570 RepID=UPI00396B382D